MDAYQEETLAKITATVRGQLQQLRTEGEAAPVALWVSPAHGRFRQLLSDAGVPGPPADNLSPVLPVAARSVVELLNRHVSPGLGAFVMDCPVHPPHAFRLVAVLERTVRVHILVFEGAATANVGTFAVNVEGRSVAVQGEDGEMEYMPAEW